MGKEISDIECLNLTTLQNYNLLTKGIFAITIEVSSKSEETLFLAT